MIKNHGHNNGDWTLLFGVTVPDIEDIPEKLPALLLLIFW
jgi:hypothetical protein